MKRLTLILSVMLALVGLNANAAIYIVGDGPLGGWAFDGGNEMTAAGNGTYTYEMTIPENAESAIVYFVFADGRGTSWDEFNGTMRIGPTSGNLKIEDANWVETQKAGGDNGAYYIMGIKGESYTVTYDETNSKFKVDGAFEQPPVGGDTYTVAGAPAALFDTEWAPGNADNDMTLVDGLYTWTKENVELSAGSISFKVVVNHSWGEAYPGQNYVQSVSTKGIYNVTITFNPDTKDVACALDLVEEIPDTDVHTYTVAGIPAAIFGTEWDAANADNDMELVEGLYTFTKNNVALTAGNISFKVVQDHSWAVAYPADNVVEPIAENGNYNVKITFNAETKAVNIEATLIEASDDFYTVAGAPAALFGTEWAPGNAANNMTLADGVYTWAKEGVDLNANTLIEFKVVKNASWTTCWPAGDNYKYTVAEAGTYNVTITFNPETEEITFNAQKTGGVDPVHYDGDVYVLGEVNNIGGWYYDLGFQMTRDEANNQYTTTIYTLGENDGYSYFSFTKQLAEDWDALAPYRFGAVSDGDYWVTDEVLGTEIPLTNGGQAFRVPAGKWNLTLNVDNMTLVIEQMEGVLGDVDNDGEASIADVSDLIDYLLAGGAEPTDSDCDFDGEIAIGDVSALIDFLLTNKWSSR